MTGQELHSEQENEPETRFDVELNLSHGSEFLQNLGVLDKTKGESLETIQNKNKIARNKKRFSLVMNNGKIAGIGLTEEQIKKIFLSPSADRPIMTRVKQIFSPESGKSSKEVKEETFYVLVQELSQGNMSLRVSVFERIIKMDTLTPDQQKVLFTSLQIFEENYKLVTMEIPKLEKLVAFYESLNLNQEKLDRAKESLDRLKNELNIAKNFLEDDIKVSALRLKAVPVSLPAIFDKKATPVSQTPATSLA